MLSPGDKAPVVAFTDQHGNTVKSSAQKKFDEKNALAA